MIYLTGITRIVHVSLMSSALLFLCITKLSLKGINQLQLICPHVSNLLQTLVWSLDSQGKRKITMNKNSNASETFSLFFF